MALAALLPMPRAVFYDANGNPLSGGFVYPTIPGGSTPKATFQDSAETTPNSHPIVLDAAGSCLLYGNGLYQLTVTDSLGNQIPAFTGLTRIIPISDAVAPALGDTIANAQSVLGINPTPFILQLPDGSGAAPSFPLVASATTGWYRHVSTPDPVTGSTNTWALIVDGVERYRMFATVLSMTMPPGDNIGVTDNTRTFHIGNDGVGYYVTTTTDHMLRVGSHTGLGPTITFGDQAGGGTGFTGRFFANNWPFGFGTTDLTRASNGIIVDSLDPPNSSVNIISGAGGTTRFPMTFYRTGAILVGNIATTDTTTTYNTTSDERLKTVAGPIANSGTLIDALAPFWHTWKGAADTTQYVGMSAQAVNAIIPGVVSPGTATPGQPGFRPWMGDWAKLTPLLIAEIKALRLRAAAQETALTALVARVAALEAKSPA